MFETRESQVIKWHDWEFEKEHCVYSDTEELISLSQMGITFKTSGILFYLSVFIKDNENVILIDNKLPTLDDLAKRLKYSVPTIKKYLKYLEEHNLIKVIKNKKQLQVYINPKLYFRTMVSLETHRLFNHN